MFMLYSICSMQFWINKSNLVCAENDLSTHLCTDCILLWPKRFTARVENCLGKNVVKVAATCSQLYLWEILSSLWVPVLLPAKFILRSPSPRSAFVAMVESPYFFKGNGTWFGPRQRARELKSWRPSGWSDPDWGMVITDQGWWYHQF